MGVLPLAAWSVGAVLAAAAGGPERLEVAVSWGGISDALVERCGLRGLENLLLQGVVEAGFAVVDQVDARGISVQLRETDQRIEVHGRRGPHEEQVEIRVAADCDSTVQLEILTAVRSVTEVLAAHRLPLARSPPAAAPLVEPEPAPALQVAVGAGVSIPGAVPLLYGARVTARYPWFSGLAAGLVLDLDVTGARRIAVGELALGGQLLGGVGALGPIRVAVGLEAAVLLHIYDRDDLGVGSHLEGRFGLPLELRFGALPLGLSLVGLLRLPGVRHRVDGRLAFAGERWGGMVRLFWQAD